MGPTALLPLRRKACWGYFFALRIRRLRPCLNPWTWVLKSSTLPLDHRNNCSVRYLEKISGQCFASIFRTAVKYIVIVKYVSSKLFEKYKSFNMTVNNIESLWTTLNCVFSHCTHSSHFSAVIKHTLCIRKYRKLILGMVYWPFFLHKLKFPVLKVGFIFAGYH